jgi:type VI secretion system protein VasG
LAALQGDAPLLFHRSQPGCDCQVVSDWTGVPLGKVLRDAAGGVLALADNLSCVFAVRTPPSNRSRKSSAPRNPACADPQQPLGAVPAGRAIGVSKTETALAVAEHLFGGEQ